MWTLPIRSYKNCADCGQRLAKHCLKRLKSQYYCFRCYNKQTPSTNVDFEPALPMYELEDDFSEKSDKNVSPENYSLDLKTHSHKYGLYDIYGVTITLSPERYKVEKFNYNQKQNPVQYFPEGQVATQEPTTIEAREITCKEETITVVRDYDDGYLEPITDFGEKIKSFYRKAVRQASWADEDDYDKWFSLLEKEWGRYMEQSSLNVDSLNDNDNTEENDAGKHHLIIKTDWWFDIYIPYGRLFKRNWSEMKKMYIGLFNQIFWM